MSLRKDTSAADHRAVCGRQYEIAFAETGASSRRGYSFLREYNRDEMSFFFYVCIHGRDRGYCGIKNDYFGRENNIAKSGSVKWEQKQRKS